MAILLFYPLIDNCFLILYSKTKGIAPPSGVIESTDAIQHLLLLLLPNQIQYLKL